VRSVVLRCEPVMAASAGIWERRSGQTGATMSRTRNRALLGSSAMMLLLFASSGAQAQCTSTLPSLTVNDRPFDLAGLVPFALGGQVNSLVSVLNTTGTAFLNQTNAFISAPPNPQPDQVGGGVWARGVGGRINTENTGATNVSAIGIPLGNVICNTKTRTDFGGYQAGADLARLNIGGWNVHGGVTVGYVEANGTDRTPGSQFTGNFQVPFAGIYGAATFGGFFVDAQVRGDFFQNQITDPANGVFNQNFSARGIAVSGNIGYNHSFGTWFIEPSAGITWSKLNVDPFNVTGTLVLLNGGLSFPGTVAIDDIESTLGRFSVRVGTTFSSGNLLLQPFVTASVLHEFSGDVTTRFRTCIAAVFLAPCGTTIDIDALQTTSRVGTYGQFALGLAGQLANTGWLGYARVDYRTGDNIDGVSINGGIRYQFTPEQLAPIVGKAPIYKAPPAPVPVAYNWTGFYIGGYVGTLWGDSDWDFPDAVFQPATTNPHYSGFIGGGQVGFNYQIGAIVLGVEGDIGGSNAKAGKACPNVVGFFFTCETHIDTLGSVTARVGYAWDRTLVYVKGGWAAGDVELRLVPNATGGLLGFAPPAVGSKTADGFTVGGGFEFGLTPNLSAKAEYMYFDFGTDRYTLGGIGGIPVDADVKGNVAKVGLNYRFSSLLPIAMPR